MKKDETGKNVMPTRIIKKPEMLNGRRRDGLVIWCNNDKQYTGKKLAALIGMRWPSLYDRILDEGWDGEDVLRMKGEPRKKTKKPHVVIAAPCSVDPASLGCRERLHRLEVIKGPSAYEKALFG